MKVSIIDYGSGNLFSVVRALEYLGAQVEVTDTPKAIEKASRLVLPGVGAFGDGMRSLQKRGFVESILGYAGSERPLLGVCLGMQMFATVSQEFGTHTGLNLIPGEVLPIPAVDVNGEPQRIPHIGWVEPEPSAPGRWENSLFTSLPKQGSVYLVHSYHFVPDDSLHRLADCSYGGHRLVAAVRADNVFGFQFHPEKSGIVGLGLLRAFLAL